MTRQLPPLLFGLCALVLGCSASAPAGSTGEAGQPADGNGGGGDAGRPSLSGSGGSGGTPGSLTGTGGSPSTGGTPGTGSGGIGTGGSPTGGGGSGLPPVTLRDPFNVVTAGAAVDIYVDAADFPAVVRAVGRSRRPTCSAFPARRPPSRTRPPGYRRRPSWSAPWARAPPSTLWRAAGKLDTAGVTGKWESAVIQAVANPRGRRDAGAGHRRQRSPRHRLRDLRAVAANRRLALVLVGRRRADAVDDDHGRRRRVQAGRAIGQVPRHLHQRRRKLQHLGGPSGSREEARPGDLQEDFRAPACASKRTSCGRRCTRSRTNSTSTPRTRPTPTLYGIVMGSSHPEMMLRNNVKEWAPWAQRSRIALVRLQRQSSRPFTTTGTPAFKRTASTKTATPWACAANMTAAWWPRTRPRTADKVALMEKIFADQRGILANRVTSDVTEGLPDLHAVQRGAADLQRRPEGSRRRHASSGPRTITAIRASCPTRPNGCARAAPASTITSRTGEIRPAISGSTSTPPALVRRRAPEVLRHGRQPALGDQRRRHQAVRDLPGVHHAIRLEGVGYTETNMASAITAMFSARLWPGVAGEITDIVMRYYQINIARRPEFMGKATFNS